MPANAGGHVGSVCGFGVSRRAPATLQDSLFQPRQEITRQRSACVPLTVYGVDAPLDVGEVAERSNATDCKSVAHAASEVRILPSPPAFARARWDASYGWHARMSRGYSWQAGWKGSTRVYHRSAEGVQRVRREGGSNSVVESQPSKLLVAGSIPVSRSSFRSGLARRDRTASRCSSVVERVLGKDEVTGSSPVIGSSLRSRRRAVEGGGPSR